MNGWRVVRSVAAVLALAGLVGTALAAFSGTDVFLPMVGRNPGVYPSQWYTKVWVYNPGDAPADVSFYLLERDKTNTGAIPFTDTVQPGDTRAYENAVFTMFGRNAWGAFRVVSTQEVVVNERFYNQPPGMSGKDTAGQYFAGIPRTFAIGTGEKTEILGVYQTAPAGSSEYRYNFGFVEVTGAPVRVRVTPSDATGAALAAAKEYQVQALSQRQLAFKDAFPGIGTENARLTVEPISGSGKVIAYGTGIANVSQDPTTFEMQFAEQLLGITAVQHDGTLAGDGTASSPLGLADGAVTVAKIGTTNSPVPANRAAGTSLAAAPATQVLATDGTTLVWQSAAQSGLASGGITFGNAGGGLAQDAGNLFWDQANRRLGLGTSVPNEQLELTGNLRLPATTAVAGTPAAGVILVGGSPFLHSYGSNNTFVGRGAGNFSSTGTGNAAFGVQSLGANTTGGANTASGNFSLGANTTGSSNTASGFNSLGANTTGYANTASGAGSLRSNTTGVGNTASGFDSLASSTTGSNNTSVGYGSLFSNTTGGGNTASGTNSLFANTTGDNNTAYGRSSLADNMTGTNNTATGYSSLASNTTGNANTANGSASLIANTTGDANVATGSYSLNRNTTGRDNTASGYYSLRSNTTASYSTASGSSSLRSNTTGGHNTASGYSSLYSNTTGERSTAAGSSSLYSNTTGQRNTAAGYQSLYFNAVGSENTAFGAYAGFRAAGDGNVFLGARAGYDETGSNRLYIANGGGTPLIYGQFDAGRVGINTLSPGQTLSVAGALGIQGGGGYTVLQGSLGQVSDITYSLPAASADGVLRNAGGTLSWDGSAYAAGAGGPGQVTFWTGGDTLAGSAALFWDAASSRLGLGTAAPGEQLELTGNLRLPATAAAGGVAAAGVITQGTLPFLHSYGVNNTFLGAAAGNLTMTGESNTVTGAHSLAANTSGSENTANGYESLPSNTVGSGNTAIGASSLYHNTGGGRNTAAGFSSLASNTAGSGNTAFGYLSLFSSSITAGNTAVGDSSLYANATGERNTTVGGYSLESNAAGSFNTAVGYWAGRLATGSGNVFLGYQAGYNQKGSNRLLVANSSGTPLIYGEFDTVRVGIGTTTAPYQLTLATDSAGKPGGGSWADSSDARLKKNVKLLAGALEKIVQLRGVSFDWFNPQEHGGLPTSAGFIAQDVEQVFPDWVSEIEPAGRDRELVGEGEKVRSLTLPFAFDAYLVEAIKEHERRLADQEARIAAQRSQIRELRAHLADLQGQVEALVAQRAGRKDRSGQRVNE